MTFYLVSWPRRVWREAQDRLAPTMPDVADIIANHCAADPRPDGEPGPHETRIPIPFDTQEWDERILPTLKDAR